MIWKECTGLENLLEAKHITKEYDGRVIIQDINLILRKGELISLLGLSGSGKTTLFHVLSGLTKPREGQVILEGNEITGRPGSVSYMLQKDLLLPHKKVIDNVSLPLVLKGLHRKEARQIAHPLFSEFGLEGTQGQYPSQLSGGMRQRCAFLRTYLSAVSGKYVQAGTRGQKQAHLHGVALLDEPFSALDTITKSQIHGWFLEMMQRIDLSAIFISHDIDEALILSDRIYVLSGTPGTITHEFWIRRDRGARKGFNLTPEFLDYKRQILQALGTS